MINMLPQTWILLAPPPAVPDPQPGASPLWSETKLASHAQRAGSELFWMVRTKKKKKPPPQQKIPTHFVGFQRLMGKSRMFPLCGGKTPDRRQAPHPLPPCVEMRGGGIKRRSPIKTAAAAAIFSEQTPRFTRVSVSWVKPL